MCVAGLQLMKKVKDEGLGFIKSNFWVTESEESTLGKLEKIEHVGENWGWSIFSNHENIEVHLRNANLGQRVLKESRALPQYLQQEWCPSQPSPVSPSWGRVSGNANAGGISAPCLRHPIHTSCRPASSWSMLLEPTLPQSRKGNRGETKDISKTTQVGTASTKWLSRHIWFEVLGISPVGMDKVNQKTGRKAVLDWANKWVLFALYNVFKNSVIWWHLKL